MFRDKFSLFAVLIVLAALLTGCPFVKPNPPPNLPNLAWKGDKLYSTGSVKVKLDGFGVNSTVDQLPAGTAGVTVTLTLENTGTEPVAAGYLVNETVDALVLRSTGTSIGFVPPTGMAPILDVSVPGPALAAGASATLSFPIAIPSSLTCGMFREVATADSTKVVIETTKSDNQLTRYFAIPGTMAVNITVTPDDAVDLWHDTKGPAPQGVTIAPSFPATVHTFTITKATPTSTFWYSYYQAPQTGSHGSTEQLTGPAPVQPPATPVAGPIVITSRENPVTDNDKPITDIALEVAVEPFMARVTAITGDGCFIRQEVREEDIWHPGR